MMRDRNQLGSDAETLRRIPVCSFRERLGALDHIA
jgi:hypothetical protein